MLSGKQKRYLRSLGMKIKPVVIIGKENITGNLIESLDVALEAHELVKIKVLETCSLPLKEISADLAEVTESELVQKIGRTILLYRQSVDNKLDLCA